MNRNTYPIAGAVITAGIAGYMLAAAHTAPAHSPAPHAPVNVSVVHEESGELRSVELTDSNGHDIPVGSVAEEFPWIDGEDGTDGP